MRRNLSTNTFSETFKELDRIMEEVMGKDKDREVYMYCTGGIRCEKASAYMNMKGCENVFQLEGGIHRYIEEINPERSRFMGKEFVFDGRVAMKVIPEQQSQEDCERSDIPLELIRSRISPAGAHPSFQSLVETEKIVPCSYPSFSCSEVIGRCSECAKTHDAYSGFIVCTVCRIPVLCCPECVVSNTYPGEYYCGRHRSLKGVYFSVLECFTNQELQEQVSILSALEHGLCGDRKERNRRRTLRRQRERIQYLLTSRPETQVDTENVSFDGSLGKERCNEDTKMRTIDERHDLSLHSNNPSQRLLWKQITENPRITTNHDGFFWQC